MTSDAQGQLLGYSIQFPRALCHLFQAGPGSKVYIEQLADVSTESLSGSYILEEDKSSVVGNPLTNKSDNIWKTFYNWIKNIQDKKMDIDKMQFVLWCNQSGRESIINAFDNASTPEQAKSALESAKNILSDINSEHSIWEHYNFAVNQNESLLLKIIERFKLQISNDAGLEDLRYEIKKALIPDYFAENCIDKLNGWLLKVFGEKVYAGEIPVILWEDFNKECQAFFGRIRGMDLIDFALYETLDPLIEAQIKEIPCYLKQLELIESTEDDILEAVTDYLRANINLNKWIENNLIDSELADDFENKLKSFWKNQMKAISITHKNFSDVERAQLLLAECQSRQEKLGDITPPFSTVSGIYYYLSNIPLLGWHAKWEEFFKDGN